MRYFNYLRNTFRPYLISGIVLSLAIFLSILVYRYNNYLVGTLHIEEDISINKEKVKNQTHKIDSVIKYLRDNLNLDLTDAHFEGLVFQTLDNIKTKMQDASITVTAFEEAEGQKKLPVEIKVSVQTYKKLIDYVEYIESFRIPKYKINQLSISKGQKGDIMLEIKGVIVTPSLKDE
jgi:hypothetical protein